MGDDIVEGAKAALQSFEGLQEGFASLRSLAARKQGRKELGAVAELRERAAAAVQPAW
jgi:hypothetical protein